MKILAPDGRVRYMTPDEYFKLMGFRQEDVDMLRANGLSNSRLYKMAGNSICVPVAKAVLEQVINAEFTENERSA
jgi:DNA (cytosine-5)-methyltransferase 1